MATEILPGLHVPDDAIDITYILASGPGGQNVNKVATAAQLRFDCARIDYMGPRILARLRQIAGSRMTDAGVIVMTGRRFRSQLRNRADILERLGAMIMEAAQKPEFRIPTRPSRSARRKRMDGKSHRAETKRNRSVRADD